MIDRRSSCAEVAVRLAFVTVALLSSTILGSAHGRQRVPQPDIGYEPTPMDVVRKMLDLARVGPADLVYDLGSGDGRIPIMAAERYGARGVGIELQPSLVEASRRRADAVGLGAKVTFIQGDFFNADLSPATVVTMYLWPTVNDRLEPTLRRELRPGTRIVSYTFPMSNWVPDQTMHLDNGRDLFLWTIPRRPARAPDVSFTPTPPKVVDEMLQLAHVSSKDVLVDLGSGDGRIVIMAAQEYGARGVGVEIVPSLVETSRRVAREGQLGDKATFVEGDLFDADLSKATVVTLSLSAQVNARLEAKLRALRPGTRIVSHGFPIGSWAPDHRVRASDGSVLYLWTVRPH